MSAVLPEKLLHRTGAAAARKGLDAFSLRNRLIDLVEIQDGRVGVDVRHLLPIDVASLLLQLSNCALGFRDNITCIAAEVFQEGFAGPTAFRTGSSRNLEGLRSCTRGDPSRLRSYPAHPAGCSGHSVDRIDGASCSAGHFANLPSEPGKPCSGSAATAEDQGHIGRETNGTASMLP
jgi:hypothetical protein